MILVSRLSFLLFRPQPHVPTDASGSMTDLSMHPQWLALIFFFFLMQKKPIRFIGRQILFGAFMAKDSWHEVNFPAFQVVVMPKCFTKSIPAEGLELTTVHQVPGSTNM